MFSWLVHLALKNDATINTGCILKVAMSAKCTTSPPELDSAKAAPTKMT